MNKTLAIFLLAFTGILIGLGLVLMILKIFGFPYLFEGIVIFSLGFISASLIAIAISLSEADKKKDKELDVKQISIFQDPEGGNSYTTNIPIEDMEKLKHIPIMKHILENIKSISKMEMGTPLSKKSIEEYNEDELKAELKKAEGKEEYERAATLKKELERRSQL